MYEYTFAALYYLSINVQNILVVLKVFCLLQ